MARDTMRNIQNVIGQEIENGDRVGVVDVVEETYAPEGETSAPKGETSAPKGETSAPEGETSAPEGETSAPETVTAND